MCPKAEELQTKLPKKTPYMALMRNPHYSPQGVVSPHFTDEQTVCRHGFNNLLSVFQLDLTNSTSPLFPVYNSACRS